MTEPQTSYIAYYRVSTDRQGASGLGLEAQREAVKRFPGGRGQLLAEFTDIESDADTPAARSFLKPSPGSGSAASCCSSPAWTGAGGRVVPRPAPEVQRLIGQFPAQWRACAGSPAN